MILFLLFLFFKNLGFQKKILFFRPYSLRNGVGQKLIFVEMAILERDHSRFGAIQSSFHMFVNEPVDYARITGFTIDYNQSGVIWSLLISIATRSVTRYYANFIQSKLSFTRNGLLKADHGPTLRSNQDLMQVALLKKWQVGENESGALYF